MQAAIEIQKGIKVMNPYPTESKYFSENNVPYVDPSEAIAQIPIALRHLGLTVNVANVEYWWKISTANGGLIAKSSGGTSSLTIEQVRSDAQIASLENGKVPLRQISSLIMESEEFEDVGQFPEVGESNKLYIALTNLDETVVAGNYKWNGIDYEMEQSSLLDKIVVLEEDMAVIPAWAKTPDKPVYTADEVGATPTTISIFLQGNGIYFPQIFKWPVTKTVSSVQRMSNCLELKVTISGIQYTINNGTPNSLNLEILAANTQMTIDSITPTNGNTTANAIIIF
jgi:hypothetical protein